MTTRKPKPKKRKPREWFVVVHGRQPYCVHATLTGAVICVTDKRLIVRVREVLR